MLNRLKLGTTLLIEHVEPEEQESEAEEYEVSKVLEKRVDGSGKTEFKVPPPPPPFRLSSLCSVLSLISCHNRARYCCCSLLSVLCSLPPQIRWKGFSASGDTWATESDLEVRHFDNAFMPNV